MAVDAQWRLYIDPRVLDAWDPDELLCCLAHETWHLVLRHAQRAKERGIHGSDLRIWGFAADLVVNAMLREASFKVPDGMLLPEQFNFPTGLTVDEYFELLLQKDEQPKQESGGGSCADGDPREWEHPEDAPAGNEEADPGPPSAIEEELTARVVAQELQEHERSCGNGSSLLARWAAKQLRPPKIRWQHVLAGSIRAAVAEAAGLIDYSYRRPSRRQGMSRVVLPSMRKHIPKVAVVVDTSSSMEKHDLTAAMSEVAGVLRAAGSGVTLFSCDSVASKAQRIFNIGAARLVGGGGTDMGAGLEAAAALRPRPDVTIVLTDCYTPWPNEKPCCGRVIIGSVARSRYPTPHWARLIMIEE